MCGCWAYPYICRGRAEVLWPSARPRQASQWAEFGEGRWA